MQITRGPRNRLYVTDPRAWAYSPGTDYIWTPSVTTAQITSGTAGQVLSEYGWVTTSMLFQTITSSAADFNSSSDEGTVNGIGTDASGDLMHSPVIFGTYRHMKAAGDILGYQPTSMTLEVDATFTVASANEPRSVFGFANHSTSDWSLAASAYVAVGSDATNFRMRDSSLTNFTNAVTGLAVDNVPHRFTIVNDGTNNTFSMDGTTYGTLAIQADLFPVSFYFHTLTTNRIFLHNIHIYYR